MACSDGTVCWAGRRKYNLQPEGTENSHKATESGITRPAQHSIQRFPGDACLLSHACHLPGFGNIAESDKRHFLRILKGRV